MCLPRVCQQCPLFRSPGSVLVYIVAVRCGGVHQHLAVAPHIVAVHPLVHDPVAGVVKIVPEAFDLPPFALGDQAGGVLVPVACIILMPLADHPGIGGSLGLDSGQLCLVHGQHRGADPLTALGLFKETVGPDLEHVVAGLGDLGGKVVYVHLGGRRTGHAH